MRLRLSVTSLSAALIAVACGGNVADDDDSAHGGASTGGSTGAGAGGTSTAGSTAMGSGGVTGGAGRTATSGAGMAGTGGSSAGASAVGGMSGTGGSAAGNAGGASGMTAMDSGAGGMPAAGANAMGGGGAGSGGRDGGFGGSIVESAGRSAGGGGAGGRGLGGASAGKSAGGMPGAGGGTAGGGSCPASGHVSYKLTKSANPTADEQAAYDLITPAMDKAVDYYNCYTNITKADTVTYVPTVQTADGSSSGSIRFGGKDYMEYITAMHEIAHTVGVGTYSEWGPLVVNGIFTGAHATAQLRAITGVADDQLHADTQHFWPYGLNYTSEVMSESDVIDHCLMVVAIRYDMGYDP